MESSSIVSFSNDSTLQSTLKPEVSVHELALHAMRDRCLLLQKRINTLESDNMRLKLQSSKGPEHSSYNQLQVDEKHTLQQKIAELTKQKSQLMHHVFMVSCENKNLWTKISNINKPEKPKDFGKQPLLRTNTYIHSTPKTSSNYQEKYSEASLEEISLKLINSYIQEKSQLVEQYEQMAQLQESHEDLLNLDSIGFTFIEEPATDSLKEIYTQTEILQNLKKELAQQELDLKFVINKVEMIYKEGYKCPTCISNNAKITSSEHKEIETSDSLMNWATPADSTTYNNENYNEPNPQAFKNIKENETEEPTDKTCPMCGRNYSKDADFHDFQSHVESHFTGETELDSIMENFDNIPQSVDNVL